jgi:predicted amidohydrolase YtcJ
MFYSSSSHSCSESKLGDTNVTAYTVDGQGTIAQAIAVKGNKIIYVGNNSGVDKHISYRTKLIDAKTAWYCPDYMAYMHIH